MTFRDAAEYMPARVLEAALGALPAGLGAALGETAGRAAGRLGVRRRVVEDQIAAGFPDRSVSWVRTTTAACYCHFGREIAAIARLGRTGGAGLPGRMEAGPEVVALHRSVTGGRRGALIVTGHLGNWEVAGAFLAAAGLSMAAVVKRQRNAAFDRRLLVSRRGLGIEPIYMEDAWTRIPEALAEGKTVALVADQDAGPRGTFVSFLGRPASTFRGPARLALTLDAPLFFGAAVRDGDGYRAILEPVAPTDLGEAPEDELTRRWVGRLEEHVRRHPEQYFWFHRRWKTRATGTPASVER